METAVKDYVQFIHADPKNEVTNIEETIENILMRLEEYRGTLEMIKAERLNIESSFDEILAMKRDIIDLTYRIDAMETFISRVHQDMCTLETQIVEAEQDLPNKSENPLKSLLKPIFSKISPELSNESSASSSSSGMSNATICSYEKVNIFNTDELFKKNEP